MTYKQVLKPAYLMGLDEMVRKSHERSCKSVENLHLICLEPLAGVVGRDGLLGGWTCVSISSLGGVILKSSDRITY